MTANDAMGMPAEGTPRLDRDWKFLFAAAEIYEGVAFRPSVAFRGVADCLFLS